MVHIAPRTVQNVMFVVHFTLAVFAMASKMFANDYFLCQSLIIALGLWSLINHESSEPLFMLGTIKGITVLLDSEMIHNSALYRFSAAIAIILLISKPIMMYFVLQLARERELDHGCQNTSLVDSFPSFGNWGKTNRAGTTTATFQNNNDGYQQQSNNNL